MNNIEHTIMHYVHAYNALYVVMFKVNPHLAYNYDYTALLCIITHNNYVHNAL